MNNGISIQLSHFYQRLMKEQFFISDEREPYFQEKVLQVIWNEQLLQEGLHTADGRRIQVHHPGTWNRSAGPDFHHARISLDGQAYHGPVEIHVTPRDWTRHKHHLDPAYDEVILHVVWDNPDNLDYFPGETPLLVLENCIACALAEVIEELDICGYPYARQVAAEGYAETFVNMDDVELQDFFQNQGLARMLEKARRITHEIQIKGLDESAYLCLAEALGYKNNQENFKQLCAILPLAYLQEQKEKSIPLFLGQAGFLQDPASITPDMLWYRELKAYWEAWWPQRRETVEIDWVYKQLRPYNHPQRRCIALALLLENCAFSPGAAMINCFLDHDEPQAIMNALYELFELPDEKWQGFQSFSKTLKKPARLLGRKRAQDFIVNIAIPHYMAWCFLHQQPEACKKAKKLLLIMPKLQDNRRLKEARSRFFIPPSRARFVIRNAAAQQGLIHSLKRYNQALELPF